MTDEPDFKAIALWATDLYEERTRLVADNKAPISIVHPAYRVTTHEVMAQFKLKLAPWMAEFQAAFQKEMKKRKLHLVLHSKIKSHEWVEQYGKSRDKPTSD